MHRLTLRQSENQTMCVDLSLTYRINMIFTFSRTSQDQAAINRNVTRRNQLQLPQPNPYKKLYMPFRLELVRSFRVLRKTFLHPCINEGDDHNDIVQKTTIQDAT